MISVSVKKSTLKTFAESTPRTAADAMLLIAGDVIEQLCEGCHQAPHGGTHYASPSGPPRKLCPTCMDVAVKGDRRG